MNLKNCLFAIVAVCVVLLSACKQVEQPLSEQEPSYSVTKVYLDSIVVNESYSATIEGRQDIAIYPQVSGTISMVCVKEGERVKKGQLLFVIDQVPYQAALRVASANVHAAQAQVETAKLEYESKLMLFAEKVISEYDLSLSKNALAMSEAALEQAKASEINAQNDLSYTEVKSPSDGVVGTLPYRAGALVGPSIPQPLTMVSDNSQMYVYFSMTENNLRSLINMYGSVDEVIKQMRNVKLMLNDRSIYEQEGYIETISGIINPQTGTASIRCVFPNDRRILFSGGVGNVILPHVEKDVLVIDQSVTYELQDKIYLYKMIDGKPVATEITISKINDGNTYIVLSGLNDGDEILSEGIIKLK